MGKTKAAKSTAKKTTKSTAATNGTNGKAHAVSLNTNGNGTTMEPRLNVQKTYKIYIGGKFPRTESGRYFQIKGKDGKLLANVSRASRKDFREAVVAARAAFAKWSGATHFNRGQIMYRIAEMLEWRKAQFVEELEMMGVPAAEAKKEVLTAIDRVVYYAGWADKYQQIFSSVNPVASSHFNFSMLEPTGVVSAYAPRENGLLGLVSALIPIIVGGNTAVILASPDYPITSITFAEVLESSDVPAGVVNILTGYRDELLGHFSTHMDVNAMAYYGTDKKEIKEVQQNATKNVKRPVVNKTTDWYAESAQSPYFIMATQETKTTWHPVGI